MNVFYFFIFDMYLFREPNINLFTFVLQYLSFCLRVVFLCILRAFCLRFKYFFRDLGFHIFKRYYQSHFSKIH